MSDMMANVKIALKATICAAIPPATIFTPLRKFSPPQSAALLRYLIGTRMRVLRDDENLCAHLPAKLIAEHNTGVFANGGKVSLDHGKLGRYFTLADVAVSRSRCKASSHLSARGRVHAISRSAAYTASAGASAAFAAAAIAR